MFCDSLLYIFERVSGIKSTVLGSVGFTVTPVGFGDDFSWLYMNNYTFECFVRIYDVTKIPEISSKHTFDIFLHLKF